MKYKQLMIKSFKIILVILLLITVAHSQSVFDKCRTYGTSNLCIGVPCVSSQGFSYYCESNYCDPLTNTCQNIPSSTPEKPS